MIRFPWCIGCEAFLFLCCLQIVSYNCSEGVAHSLGMPQEKTGICVCRECSKHTR